MYDQNITAHEHQALLPQVCSFCFALNIQLHLSGSCSSDHDGLQCKLLVLTPCLHGSLLQLPSSFLLVLFFLQLACLLAAFLHSEGAKLELFVLFLQVRWGEMKKQLQVMMLVLMMMMRRSSSKCLTVTVASKARKAWVLCCNIFSGFVYKPSSTEEQNLLI